MIRCSRTIVRYCSSAVEEVPVKKVKKVKLRKRIWAGIKMMAGDYKLAVKDVKDEVRDAPVKAVCSAIILGIGGVLFKTNPSFKDFKDQQLKHHNDMLLSEPATRNNYCENYMLRLRKCSNFGQVKRTSFGLFSLLWIDDYDADLDIYTATCRFLKVGWLDMPDRVIDVGIYGRWRRIDYAMADYDKPKTNVDRKLPAGLTCESAL